MAAAINVGAQVQPPNCTPGGLGALISIATPTSAFPPYFAHVGDTLTITRVAANLSGTGCNLTNGNFWVTYPSGGTTQAMSGFVLTQGGEIQCVQAPANAACLAFPTSYIIKASDIDRDLSFTMPKGNQCVRPGLPKLVHFMVSDEADLVGSGLTASGCGNVAVEILTPGIACVKNCANAIGQNGQITFSGYVTNTGDTALFNVSVSNLVNGTLTLLTNISTLNVGARVNFGGSYTPANPCVPTSDTIFVRGTDIANLTVTSQCSATCSNILTPCITVTKNCTGPVLPGAAQVISGVVSNCGNVNLTNVIITDNILGPVTVIPNLAIGQSLPYSMQFTAGCVGNTNTVTARATSICGQNVTNTATAVCPVTFTPCLAVTKNCDTVSIGQPNTVSGFVTNCGNITITNISIVDNIYGTLATGISLQPGASQAYSRLVTNANCGNFPNIVTAAGTTICGGGIEARATNVCVVVCRPQICVTKEVVCELPTGCDTNWSKLAIGVRSGDDCPVFCYRITVENCGLENLRDVTVTDPDLNLSSCNFPTTLAVGQKYTCIIPGVELCDGLINTVTAAGTGVGSGIRTNDTDFAEVRIREISITCEVTVNGERFIEIPCDGQPHLVTNAIRICNTGDLPLANIRLFAPHLVALGGACANIENLVLSLAPGACTNIELCVDAPVCEPDCGIAFSNYVKVTAWVDLSKTNVCAYTHNATNGLVLITTDTECSAVVGCTQPNACRVTGGGRQDDPLAYPHNVRYVTHGGQVGAPVGNKVCEVTDDFYLGNPCIHGRWTHVRHQQGGLRGNFHARYYDTLECICLGITTNRLERVAFGNQVYTNAVYDLGTVENNRCNPDDHKVAGPQPRPAGANKIVFTGVGDWADPNGRRAPRACLFRVDIEDRSEPGGSHPKGGVDPADRYRIRIWVLSNEELAKLRGAGTGSDKYLKGFRNAISACIGTDVVDGATVPNGAAAFGVRRPDIDDGGELERGNHQIHPAIKNCDPYNPTGPGLPPGGN